MNDTQKNVKSQQTVTMCQTTITFSIINSTGEQ